MVINTEGYIHIIEYLTEHLRLFEQQANATQVNAITVMTEIETQLSEQIITVCLQNELLTSNQRNVLIREIDLIASDLSEVFSSVASNPVSTEQQEFIKEFSLLIKNLFDIEIHTLIAQPSES